MSASCPAYHIICSDEENLVVRLDEVPAFEGLEFKDIKRKRFIKLSANVVSNLVYELHMATDHE